MERGSDEVLWSLSHDHVNGSVFVFLDETYSPTVAVGAVVVESSQVQRIESSISDLYEKLRDSYQLDGLRSFQDFHKRGFHATGDPREVGTAFVAFLAETLDFKSLIVYSDGTLRSELSCKKRHMVVAYELLRDVLRAYKGRPKITLCFESTQAMDTYLARIVEQAVRNLGPKRPQIEVCFGTKRNPHLLAVPDYVLHIFNRWLAAQDNGEFTLDPADHESRSFRAILGSISMARSLEGHRIIRRTLDARKSV